jgi:glycolate oxidase FAD binding subunit
METYRPASAAEAAGILRDTTGTVLFRGGGTKMRWGGRAAAPDLVVETGGMNRLLTHEPADMTASVEAGMTLDALQERLAGSGQWLALDPPARGGGATIGGLLATGDSGPRRLRYGALRDLVIGVTLVLADGTVAHAGGHVIKNVAGYDLAKLSYGSLGTLGLIAEVVLRVHPRTEASATLVTGATAAAATAGTLRLLAAPLEPVAVDWAGDGSAGRLAVRFEGSKAGVEAQTAGARDLLGGGDVLVGPDEDALWRDLTTASANSTASGPAASGLRSEATREDVVGEAPGPARAEASANCTAFAGTLPSRLPEVVAALMAAGDATGARVWLASHAGLGLHTAYFDGDPAAQAAAFTRWRDAVRAIGGTVVLRDRPDGVDGAVDPLGPPPSSAPLLRALKARLDPAGRCGPGRLGDWLG